MIMIFIWKKIRRSFFYGEFQESRLNYYYFLEIINLFIIHFCERALRRLRITDAIWFIFLEILDHIVFLD